MVTGGNFFSVRVAGKGKKGLNILLENVDIGAIHNSGERYDPSSHPNTRTVVIAGIKKGAASAGKSALAQILAESLNAGRNDEKRVIATLVYQTLQAVPETKFHVEAALERDPLLFSRLVEVQQLLFDPLLTTFPSTINASDTDWSLDPPMPSLTNASAWHAGDRDGQHTNFKCSSGKADPAPGPVHLIEREDEAGEGEEAGLYHMEMDLDDDDDDEEIDEVPEEVA
ncbi:hypothetical protein BDZ97DRAFT_1919802 [Flammula alnicola]|nr:hypothetical protein BDZ97DRAFT_1919802 [Flammula alnicola]